MKKLFFVFLFLLNLTFLFSEEIIISSLQEAISFAMINEKSIFLMKEKARVSALSSKLSFENFLPVLSASWNDSATRVAGQKDSSIHKIDFSFEQPFFNGGKNLFALQKAKHDAQNSIYSAEQKSQEFKMSVMKQFISCIVLEKEYELRKNFCSIMEEELRLSKAEYDRGLSLEDDYLSFMISLMEEKSELEDCQYQKEAALRSFKILSSVEKEVNLILQDKVDWEVYNKKISEKYEDIWKKVCEKSLPLKQKSEEIKWLEKSKILSSLFWLPKISVLGNISFSGESYPLTEPKFSLGFSLSFSDAPLGNSSAASSISFSDMKTEYASLGVNKNLSFNPSYAAKLRLGRLSIREAENSLEEEKKVLKENLLSVLNKHDRCVEKIEMLKRKITLLERRLEIDKIKVHKGTMKRTDYLEHFIEALSSKIELLKIYAESACSVYELDIMSGIKFGEVCDEIGIH